MKTLAKFKNQSLSYQAMKSLTGGQDCIRNTAARSLKSSLGVPDGYKLANVRFDKEGCFVYADIVPEGQLIEKRAY